VPIVQRVQPTVAPRAQTDERVGRLAAELERVRQVVDDER
jgi:hypothetical protein